MTEEVPNNANEGCPGTSNDEAGKAAACQGCPNQATCASAPKGPDPGYFIKATDLAAIQERLAAVKRIILVLSGKGGVGKSTVATQLAFSLAEAGQEVGLLDVDLCGPSVPKLTGLEGEEIHRSNAGWSPVYVQENLAVMSIGFMLPDPDNAVIWRGPRKNGLIKQFLKDVDWGELDTLLIDTPPGTSDEHISLVQLLQGTNLAGAVVVTTPQEVSIADVRKELSFCRKTGVTVLGVIENMSTLQLPLTSIPFIDPQSGADVTQEVLQKLQSSCPEVLSLFTSIPVFQTSGGGAKMAMEYGVPFAGKVPMDPSLGVAGEKGLSLSQIEGGGPAAAAFKNIVSSLLGGKDVGSTGAVNGGG